MQSANVCSRRRKLLLEGSSFFLRSLSFRNSVSCNDSAKAKLQISSIDCCTNHVKSWCVQVYDDVKHGVFEAMSNINKNCFHGFVIQTSIFPLFPSSIKVIFKGEKTKRHSPFYRESYIRCVIWGQIQYAIIVVANIFFSYNRVSCIPRRLDVFLDSITKKVGLMTRSPKQN